MSGHNPVIAITYYVRMKKRVYPKTLESMVRYLSKITGDPHYLEGTSARWTLRRASDGAALQWGNGVEILDRMQKYARGHEALLKWRANQARKAAKAAATPEGTD